MYIPTVISIPFHNKTVLPNQFRNDDIRYPEELVEYFLERFTRKDDTILDPFAGFGTTLIVAKRLGRKSYGIEIDETRVAFLSKHLELENIYHSDIRMMNLSSLPKFDFMMTSPPYMTKDDTEYALSGYTTRENYTKYLKEIGLIFTRIKDILKPNAKLVIEVANIKVNSIVTTLAWDIAFVLSKIYLFEGEIIVNWEGERKPDGIYGSGYDHSYCLVFRNE